MEVQNPSESILGNNLQFDENAECVDRELDEEQCQLEAYVDAEMANMIDSDFDDSEDTEEAEQRELEATVEAEMANLSGPCFDYSEDSETEGASTVHASQSLGHSNENRFEIDNCDEDRIESIEIVDAVKIENIEDYIEQNGNHSPSPKPTPNDKISMPKIPEENNDMVQRLKRLGISFRKSLKRNPKRYFKKGRNKTIGSDNNLIEENQQTARVEESADSKIVTKLYKCPVCFVVFTSQVDIYNHMEWHHKLSIDHLSKMGLKIEERLISELWKN